LDVVVAQLGPPAFAPHPEAAFRRLDAPLGPWIVDEHVVHSRAVPHLDHRVIALNPVKVIQPGFRLLYDDQGPRVFCQVGRTRELVVDRPAVGTPDYEPALFAGFGDDRFSHDAKERWMVALCILREL
jgi:hypothetical protein